MRTESGDLSKINHGKEKDISAAVCLKCQFLSRILVRFTERVCRMTTSAETVLGEEGS